VRTLLHNLRTGATGKTIEAAAATAVIEHRGGNCGCVVEAIAAFKICFSQHPVWEHVVGTLLEGGVQLMRQVCTVLAGLCHVFIKDFIASCNENNSIVVKPEVPCFNQRFYRELERKQ
jgi:hypothetical protein